MSPAPAYLDMLTSIPGSRKNIPLRYSVITEKKSTLINDVLDPLKETQMSACSDVTEHGMVTFSDKKRI